MARVSTKGDDRLSGAQEAIDLMRDFIAQSKQRGSVERDLAGWAAQWFEQYLDTAHLGITLDDACGVTCGPGERSWWYRDQRRTWAALLRATAATFFPGRTPRHQAIAIENQLHVYCRRRWKTDRAAAVCPYASDTINAALFELMKVGAAFGSSPLTVQRVLEGSDE